jgi:glycosyltransferase involved in cell wall biosynthesis
MVGASNKPFDYLASGLVIIVPDTIEWKEFFVDRKCAVACDSEDSHSISEALEWCWRNRDQLRTMNSFGREMLESEWNYEAQFEPVRLLLERTITHT